MKRHFITPVALATLITGCLSTSSPTPLSSLDALEKASKDANNGFVSATFDIGQTAASNWDIVLSLRNKKSGKAFSLTSRFGLDSRLRRNESRMFAIPQGEYSIEKAQISLDKQQIGDTRVSTPSVAAELKPYASSWKSDGFSVKAGQLTHLGAIALALTQRQEGGSLISYYNLESLPDARLFDAALANFGPVVKRTGYNQVVSNSIGELSTKTGEKLGETQGSDENLKKSEGEKSLVVLAASEPGTVFFQLNNQAYRVQSTRIKGKDFFILRIHGMQKAALEFTGSCPRDSDCMFPTAHAYDHVRKGEIKKRTIYFIGTIKKKKDEDEDKTVLVLTPDQPPQLDVVKERYPDFKFESMGSVEQNKTASEVTL